MGSRCAWILPLLLAAPALASGDEPIAADLGQRLELDVVLQNLLLYRTDADFDYSTPAYSSQGQSVGLLGTFLRPRLSWLSGADFGVTCEVELGLNLWSMHSSDQDLPGRSDAFLVRHRELHGWGRFPEAGMDFKLGYQALFDPTGLVLGHWVGAGELGLELEGLRLALQVGQIPDQTYEGIAYELNNFARDVFFLGLRGDWDLGEGLALRAELIALYDGSEVGHERKLLALPVRLEWSGEALVLRLDGVLQGGELQRHALGDRDAWHVAWALAGELLWDLSPVQLEAHLLVLGPDDAHDHNGWNHAFLYSGKSRSRTLILTEDELRDLGRNLDERLSEKVGALNLNRAGLAVVDVYAGWDLAWFRPGVVLGAGLALQPDNALGEVFVGFEADVDLAFRYRELLEAHVVLGLLVPGGAAGLAVNRISPTATDPVFQAELSLALTF